MKVFCTQENFNKAIFNTERITGKQITLPILNNILIETEKGRLKFSATNLEIGVVSIIGVKIEKEGKITVPAKLISNFVNNLPHEGKILLEMKNQTLLLSTGNFKAQIKGLDPQDFPIIPKREDGFLFSIPAQNFKNAIMKILLCISINETRPELTGVNILFSDQKINLAATDSFRLAEETITISDIADNYKKNLEKNNSIIIPSNTLSEVAKIITPETEKIQVSIEENQIFFLLDDVYVVSRLINGKYPEYKQIIPKTFATRAVFKKEDILRAVKIASAFTNTKAGEIAVKIDAESKKIIITAQSQETGENISQINADTTGPSQNITLNPRFVLDGINPINTSNIAFLVNNNTSPAAIKAVDEKTGKIIENHTYIVMPIKN